MKKILICLMCVISTSSFANNFVFGLGYGSFAPSGSILQQNVLLFDTTSASDTSTIGAGTGSGFAIDLSYFFSDTLGVSLSYAGTSTGDNTYTYKAADRNLLTSLDVYTIYLGLTGQFKVANSPLKLLVGGGVVYSSFEQWYEDTTGPTTGTFISGEFTGLGMYTRFGFGYEMMSNFDLTVEYTYRMMSGDAKYEVKDTPSANYSYKDADLGGSEIVIGLKYRL